MPIIRMPPYLPLVILATFLWLADGPRLGRTADDIYPAVGWESEAAPASLGWSAAKLARAEAFAHRIGSAAVMVVDRGIVVAAWGRVSHRYPLHSIRKPLISALVGIHVAEGVSTSPSGWSIWASTTRPRD